MSNVKVIEVRCKHHSIHRDTTIHEFASFPNEVPDKLGISASEASQHHFMIMAMKAVGLNTAIPITSHIDTSFSGQHAIFTVIVDREHIAHLDFTLRWGEDRPSGTDFLAQVMAISKIQEDPHFP